jgi:hypothetical protein
LAVFLLLGAFVIAIAFIGIYVAPTILIALFMMSLDVSWPLFGRHNILPSAAVGAGVPITLFLCSRSGFWCPCRRAMLAPRTCWGH